MRALFVGGLISCISNDAAISLKRAKHPEAFGEPLRKAWADVWEGVGALVEQVISTGKAVLGEDLPVVLERGQSVEAAWFTFSYTPLRDESGRVAGVFTRTVVRLGRETVNRAPSGVVTKG